MQKVLTLSEVVTMMTMMVIMIMLIGLNLFLRVQICKGCYPSLTSKYPVLSAIIMHTIIASVKGL